MIYSALTEQLPFSVDDESKAQTKSVKRSLAEKKASSPPGKSAATPEPKRQKSVKDFFKQGTIISMNSR